MLRPLPRSLPLSPRCRLLALDLDGTLLRDDGQIDPRDVAAVARARAQGITVLLATGRLPPTTLPIARVLGLEGVHVTADGALTVKTNGEVVRAVPLAIAARQQLVALGAANGLALLALSDTAALALAPNRQLAEWLGGWTGDFVALGSLDDLLDPARLILAAFLLGPPAALEALAAREGPALQAAGALVDVFALGLPEQGALRLRPGDVDKSTAVAAIAREMDISAAETAAVGDWYNDIGLLAWAGHSFVMGHAPEDVAGVARHRLRANAAEGGAIAEAVAALLGAEKAT